MYHLDKHFFQAGWQERNYADFVADQQDFVNQDAWIIDGNATRTLEMCWSQADVVIYFNYSRLLCFYPLLKRFWKPNKTIDDRAEGCSEVLHFKLLRYMWFFDNRVKEKIVILQEQYQETKFFEIQNQTDLGALVKEITRN